MSKDTELFISVGACILIVIFSLLFSIFITFGIIINEEKQRVCDELINNCEFYSCQSDISFLKSDKLIFEQKYTNCLLKEVRDG